MERSAIIGRLILLAITALVVVFLSLPEAAHAHSGSLDPPPHMDIDVHGDASEKSGAGHCHGDASCSTGLHIVFATPATAPDRPPLPALNRSPTIFRDANLGREPPIPIAVF